MPNLRRSGAFADLRGEARILAQGREICSLLSDGHEYEKISVLLSLEVATAWRYASLWRRHERETQQPAPTRGTAGLKD